MRVVFMGSSEFSLPTLEGLQKSEHDIVAVYTRMPKPAGRGHSLTKTPVHLYSESQGLEVRTPKSLKVAEENEILSAYKPDVIVVVSYGLILPRWVLDASKVGCINVHPSLLPRWRGAAPMEYSLLSGDVVTGVTIMRIDEGIDSGDILLQERTNIGDNENIVALSARLSVLGRRMLLDVLENIDNIEPIKQNDELATYTNKITEFRIDFNNTADHICRQIRASYPRVYCMLGNERVRILDAESYRFSGMGAIGEIINKKLHIKCGNDTALVPLVVQRESKKACDIESFIRGFRGMKIP